MLKLIKYFLWLVVILALSLGFDQLMIQLPLHGPVPLTERQFVQTHYSNLNLLYCTYESEGEVTTIGLDEDVAHNWDLYFEGGVWIGLGSDLSFVYYSKDNAILADLIPQIANYVTTNYPAETIDELTNYYSPTYGEMIYYLYLGNDVELVFDVDGVLLDQLKRATKVVFNKSISQKELKKEQRKKHLNHEN